MTIRGRACPAPSSGQWRFCERRPVSASCWKRLAPPTTLDAKDWSATPARGIAAVRSGDTGRDCTYRLSPEEKRGDPRCLGHPLRACRAQRPRRVRPAPRPSLGAVAVAFRLSNTLGTLESRFLSWLHGSRPTRSRTYASPNPLPFPAQGSLPAGRAHPWPGGFRTRWMTNKVS